MSYLDAAAITMNYTVAYMLLFELANLTPGKSLLLHSAGGGVVSFSFNDETSSLSHDEYSLEKLL